jgi:peroxiredoxin
MFGRKNTALQVLTVACILIAVIGCSFQPQDQDPPQQPAVAAFSIEKLNEYRGQVVVLNFWAAWCLPCVVEMPSLEAIHQEFQDQGVAVIGVNVTENSTAILDFAQEQQLSFPLFRDPQQTFMKSQNVRVLPTTLFIDRDGHIQYRKLGGMTESSIREQLVALIE